MNAREAFEKASAVVDANEQNAKIDAALRFDEEFRIINEAMLDAACDGEFKLSHRVMIRSQSYATTALATLLVNTLRKDGFKATFHVCFDECGHSVILSISWDDE